MKQFTILAIALLGLVVAISATTTTVEAELDTAALLRQMIRAEVQSAIQAEFDKSKVKSVASAAVSKASPYVNQAVDKVQSDLYNYGSSDAGVFNVIPESVRQKTAGVVGLVDD